MLFNLSLTFMQPTMSQAWVGCLESGVSSCPQCSYYMGQPS